MHPHEEKQTAGLGCGCWGEGSQYASVTVRCCSLHAPHLCSDPAWHLLIAAPPFLMRGSRLCTVLPAAEHPGRGLCPCLGPSAQLSLLKAEFPSCHPELRGAWNLADVGMPLGGMEAGTAGELNLLEKDVGGQAALWFPAGGRDLPSTASEWNTTPVGRGASGS